MALNAVARARAELRARGVAVNDLSVSNPTEAGFEYPDDILLPLADPRGRSYAPEPLGLASAREAVAEETAVPADRIVLTASTSEAYGVLFKLLCNPGEAVLVPQPSYPLFEFLTRLEGVEPRPYRLDYQGVWSIDRPSLEHSLGPDVRAILVVSPNNPTGSMLRASDRDWLADLAAARGVALISDQVFDGYMLDYRPDASSLAREPSRPSRREGSTNRSQAWKW